MFRPTQSVASAAVVAGLLLGLATDARAQQPEPDKRMEMGLALFKEKKFDAAAVIFESLYNDSNRSDALFAWAQSLRLDGDCKRAVPLYKRYIATEPGAEQVEAATTVMNKCGTEKPDDNTTGAGGGDVKPLDNSGETTMGDTGTKTQPDKVAGGTTIVPPSGGDKVEPRGGRDWTVIGLGAGAGLGIALGGTFIVLSRSSASSADGAESYDDYIRFADQAESRELIGYIAGGTGIALGVAALVYHLTRSKSGVDTVTVAPTSDLRGAALTVTF